jgi:transcriptional regulator with XRE-family HTH domain
MAREFKTDTKELRKMMIEFGYGTIVELSEASGVNRNTLGKVVNGEIQPSADVMYKLAKTLKMSPEKAGTTFFATNLLST